MNIGITYDLRSEYLAAGFGEEETAEFDRDDTIDSIETALRRLTHDVDRIGHARQLIGRLANGDRWDLVFNICEGMYGIGREAQVPAILDVYEIPYTFADPCVMSVCLHKGLTKAVVGRAGVPTAPFAIVELPEDVTHVSLPFPLFVKPIAEGTGKGVTPDSKVRNKEQLANACAMVLDRYRQPALVERFLPGREFTVGVVGTGPDARVLGTLEIVLRPDAEAEVYSYLNKERCEELVEYRLVRAGDDAEVRQAEEAALAAWRVLGCRDGGRIDLRSNEQGEPHFIEANPLAGLHPAHSDLPMLASAIGMTYVELVSEIIDSARVRVSTHARRRSPQRSHE
jgi:D-alanine-D-alanine ligase